MVFLLLGPSLYARGTPRTTTRIVRTRKHLHRKETRVVKATGGFVVTEDVGGGSIRLPCGAIPMVSRRVR
jgi:hypothetical protein